MSSVVHFEIPIKDFQAAIQFYTNVFGWKVEKMEGMDYYLVTTHEQGTPGIDGALYTPEDGYAGTVNTIGVGDLDATVAKLLASGGKTLNEKGHIPGVGWFIYASDPEGNRFGILQPDPDSTM